MKKKSINPRESLPPKSIFPYLLVFFGVFLALNFWATRNLSDHLSYSAFLDLIQKDQVQSVRISKELILGTLKVPLPDGKTRFSTARLDDPQMVSLLKEKKVEIIAEPEMPFWTKLLLWSLPLFLPLRWWLFSVRRGLGDGRGGLLGLTHYRDWETDRKSTRLNSSHLKLSRMPSSA